MTEVDLTACEEDGVSGALAGLMSMPWLRSRSLRSSFAEGAVDGLRLGARTS